MDVVATWLATASNTTAAYATPVFHASLVKAGLTPDDSRATLIGASAGIVLFLATKITLEVLLAIWTSPRVFADKSRETFFYYFRRLPGVRGVVAKEKAAFLKELGVGVKLPDTEPLGIPKRGRSAKRLLAEMDEMLESDYDWKNGRTLGFVYHGGDAHTELMLETYARFLHSNPLHAAAFPTARRMEAEVVRMTCTMLNGGHETCGTTTSGGTESILLMVKAARDWAREHRPHIKAPEILVSRTSHAAYDKAAAYFNLNIVHVEVDKKTKMLDVGTFTRAVTRNTILMVTSAPTYPHGLFDPIPEIAAWCYKRNMLLHVDGCLGGFLNPWIEKLGVPIPVWDFRNPGVTSISIDTHKYGYSSKGASVICYRDASLRTYQFFAYPDWPGGMMGSPTMAGSRPGGLIACAWASMMAMGESGYLACAKKIMASADALRKGISKIDGIKLVGDPLSSVMAFCSDSDDVDILAVAEWLEEHNWMMERQQYPNAIHITVTNRHTLTMVRKFLADLATAVQHIREHPELAKKGAVAMYGKAPDVPDRGVVGDLIKAYLESLYTVD